MGFLNYINIVYLYGIMTLLIFVISSFKKHIQCAQGLQQGVVKILKLTAGVVAQL